MLIYYTLKSTAERLRFDYFWVFRFDVKACVYPNLNGLLSRHPGKVLFLLKKIRKQLAVGRYGNCSSTQIGKHKKASADKRC